ncbi:MAG: bifunctional diaminohydroxyphosphoribosylaminopyrimidine deaminase/5-amino-6-(5-phosphoribosylamino)uracil reductase RibD [Gammaproteobacteria bacterium]|nr:bifunctional diaminohydroxyphosphoribosylaminopyrimidine deaminase/5-amino-6-(5-phosphoribosylamino)uracil reductase RibD [Gammaproteobacteria bacterium]
MAKAHQQAAEGLISTNPNPRVGCLLVKGERVVGSGHHIRAGGPHAEIHALNQAGSEAAGATAYVTLEPCSHHGKTPPCCEALIRAGVKRVVVALQDPNPAVAGKGIQRLRAAGIEVQSGLLADECEQMNPGFLSRMRKNRPYIRIKMAASLDGRTAMASGESQWITGPQSRNDVQQLRARSSAILTGAGTIVVDNPSLNVRGINGVVPPLRVVLDTKGRVPASSRLFTIKTPIVMVIAEGCEPPEAWLDHPQIRVISLRPGVGGVDLGQLMEKLAEMEVNELHVEAGATLCGALVREQLMDELVLYTAPVLMGSEARPLFQLPLASMSQKMRLQIVDLRKLGEDIRITARPLWEENLKMDGCC